MNTFYTRKFLGLDKSNGQTLYEDGGNTFYYLGDPNPKTLLGISSTFRYKKFSLTANMYGAFGQKIFNANLFGLLNVYGIGGGNMALSVYKNPVKESLTNPVITIIKVYTKWRLHENGKPHPFLQLRRSCERL